MSWLPYKGSTPHLVFYLFTSLQGTHLPYHILIEKDITSNITIMTNRQLRRLVAALGALLTVSIITSYNILIGYENMAKAVNAVDSYIEKTADTGEMDEFISSTDGEAFIKYAYDK